MTSPLAQAGAGSPPIASVGGAGIPDMLPIIMQALQASRARKLRQAETALGSVPGGATFGELSPEAQKSVQLATGRKFMPDEVVTPLPLTSDEAATNRLIKELGLEPTSTLAMGLKGRLAAKIATGEAGPIATPEQLGVEQETAATAGRAKLGEAKGREQEAKSFQSALGKLKAGTSSQGDFTPDELAAFQRFNNFVPSQPVADQLTGQARAEVMKQALRMASDPNSTTLAKALSPFGISPADAIGAFALGVGSVLETAISRKAAIDIASIENAGKANEAAVNALFGTAEEISKRMGGAYSPSFIAQVMEGNPKALATDAGQLVQRFTSSGYTTALTDLATKGDPASISMKQLLEVARIPQIAGDEKLLSQYSNLAQQSLAATLTRTFTGMDRPTEAGDEQSIWDAVNNSMLKKTAGVFTKDYFLGLVPKGMTITPQGKAEEQRSFEALPDATKRKMKDVQIVDETLRALFGEQGVMDTTGAAK